MSAPSPIVITVAAIAPPLRVALTTGVNDVPVNVTTAPTADADVPDNSPVNPVAVDKALMAVATALASELTVALVSEIGVLPAWTPLPESNSKVRRPPRMATVRRSPSAGKALKSIVFARITGWGTTETTWAPSSTR